MEPITHSNTRDPIKCFNEIFKEYLGNATIKTKSESPISEERKIEKILIELDQMLAGGTKRRKVVYFLGLVIDFALLTERCLQSKGITSFDPERGAKEFFEKFPLIKRRRNSSKYLL